MRLDKNLEFGIGNTISTVDQSGGFFPPLASVVPVC